MIQQGAYMTTSELNNLGQLLTNIETYFMQIGFNQPSSLQNCLNVFITYFDDSGKYGECDKTTGYIYLNKARWHGEAETVSHEYFHTVQRSYQFALHDAFQETTATYASLQYSFDNDIPIGELMKKQYQYFFENHNPIMFCYLSCS